MIERTISKFDGIWCLRHETPKCVAMNLKSCSNSFGNLETGVVVWHTRAPRNAQTCYRIWASASGTRFVASLDTDLVGYKLKDGCLYTYPQEFRLPGQGGLGARCAVGEAVLATGNTHSEDIFTWRIVPRPSRADSVSGE